MATPRVLIADDSPLVLRMIEKMLVGAGLEVITARDGLEAIERAVGGDVDLVILDVMMPRMNGYQACRLLKTEPSTKSIPVVILTSRDQAGDRFWGLETGADYYLTKDSEPARIVELVKNVLATSAPRRPPSGESQRSELDILSRVNELLDRKLYEATILSEIGRVARSLVQFEETFSSVMALVARVVDFTVGAMAFVEDEELEIVLMLNRRAAPSVVEEAREKLLEAIVKERGGRGFLRVEARLFAPPGAVNGAEEASLGAFSAFPVVTNSRLTGLLGVGGRAVARLDAETHVFLGQVANQAHIVMENSRLFERVRNLSIRDSLTDLFNHRHTIELVQHEYERVGRYQESFSILLADVDHFKRVNDELGHPVGDIVLRDLALLLRHRLRTVDAVGRYGGEEFVAILPHTNHEEARQTAERVRVAVEGHVFRVADRELRVTISIGVATFPASGIDSPASLIRAADQGLYRAKQGGRNQIA